ncbi:MAG: hypothetical protein WBA68_13225 [Alteraurantiacibacter sp.]
MAKPNHITDRIADSVDDALESTGYRGNDNGVIPGPSTNPATNLIINDIILRSVGRLTRQTVEKALLGKQYGKQFAKDAVENRSMMHALAAYGVTKFATKSIPGFALISTGLAAKVLFDRSQSRRKARRDGEATLRKQSDPDSAI